jgi:hypothetical protein
MLSSCGAKRQGHHTKTHPRLRKIERKNYAKKKKKKKKWQAPLWMQASKQASLPRARFAEEFSF